MLKLRTPFLLTGTYKLETCEVSVKIFRVWDGVRSP